MTDEEVHEHPYKALMRYSDELTSDQLDYCVHECPAIALECCADKLSEEQKQYCEEKTK